MNPADEAKNQQNSILNRAAVVIGIFICLNFLPLSLMAILFVIGIVPSAALIFVIVFYVRAWKKTENNQPFAKPEYVIFVSSSILGLAVAALLVGGIVVANWAYVGTSQSILSLIYTTFLAGSYLIAAIFSLVTMMRYQKRVLVLETEASASLQGAVNPTVPQDSNPQPVPTPEQPAQVQAPQNPPPPSDTLKPQS